MNGSETGIRDSVLDLEGRRFRDAPPIHQSILIPNPITLETRGLSYLSAKIDKQTLERIIGLIESRGYSPRSDRNLFSLSLFSGSQLLDKDIINLLTAK